LLRKNRLSAAPADQQDWRTDVTLTATASLSRSLQTRTVEDLGFHYSCLDYPDGSLLTNAMTVTGGAGHHITTNGHLASG